MEEGMLSKNEKYILTALLLKGATKAQRSLRFNELRRELDKEGFLMPDNGKPMATPTLIRNLRKLEKNEWVKRQKLGKQNISYFLLDRPEMRARSDLLPWYMKNMKGIDSLDFDGLYANLVNISCIHVLELLKTRLKHIVGILSDTDYNFEHGYLDTLYSVILHMLISRCTEEKERFKSEINGATQDITGLIEILNADLDGTRTLTRFVDSTG